MPYDFKKEFKQFYLPPKEPGIITIPNMNFVAVRGSGNPNDADGAYQNALPLLYGIAWTIKMSDKGTHQIDGFFAHTVPPLEGLWWQEGGGTTDYTDKDGYHWISMLRLPDFVKQQDFDWAADEATRKKKLDFSPAEFFSYDEGLCVQCMHLGSYDEEPATIARMDQYAIEQGCQIDMTATRYHHELYLSDPNKADPEKMKTVLRHPIKKVTV